MDGRPGRGGAGHAILLAFLTVGCGPTPGADVSDPADEPVPLGARFDPANAGTIQGRVTWEGDVPEVPRFTVWGNLLDDSLKKSRHQRDNPNRPRVDPKTHGVANAVVFLRDVDPERSRPWDHEAVRVEMRDYEMHVLQRGVDFPFGFVRRNEEVEMLSRQPVLHALRTTGAAFFTLPFPDPDQPLRRRLVHKGVVELTSGLGYYWMRGYLFVDEHPYYARTDAEGRFLLAQVPAGTYELLCWMPNWHGAGQERDPESSRVIRWPFRPPVEKFQSITVPPSATVETSFALSGADFAR